MKIEGNDSIKIDQLIDAEEFCITQLIQVRKIAKEEMIRHKDNPDKLDQLYKESMKFKHEINSKLTEYDDEFMKAMRVNKNE